MRVFKFGGASVKDADGVRNLAGIIQANEHQPLMIVVSAMGKTTNLLEQITRAYFYERDQLPVLGAQLRDNHRKILDDLFPMGNSRAEDDFNNQLVELEWILEDEMNHGYDHTYDQIVSTGELLSTRIIYHYLNQNGLPIHWLDVRDVIKTDDRYREARPFWKDTADAWDTYRQSLDHSVTPLRVITQGFIGCTKENNTTTLGREGSDYSAAILSRLCSAPDLTIWKDVPGVLTADPRKFPDAVLIKSLSYHDAVELTYYGATVIHPKTIKPLYEAGIPLCVKSFYNPTAEGTRIDKNQKGGHLPSFIHKGKQLLISISAKDFSFLPEEHVQRLFSILSEHRIKVNLMQHSALSFSICIDSDEMRVPSLLSALKAEFKILYNEDLNLFTVRYYDSESYKKLAEDKEVLLEQRSRHTLQLVIR